MKDFRNKVAAITGAGSGMGRSLAVLLASRGCHVALSDINEAGLAETVKLLDGTGIKVTAQKLDVADKAAVFAWAEQVARDHGKITCNVLISQWLQGPAAKEAEANEHVALAELEVLPRIYLDTLRALLP